jgi:hypothetical protein
VSGSAPTSPASPLDVREDSARSRDGGSASSGSPDRKDSSEGAQQPAAPGGASPDRPTRAAAAEAQPEFAASASQQVRAALCSRPSQELSVESRPLWTNEPNTGAQGARLLILGHYFFAGRIGKFGSRVFTVYNIRYMLSYLGVHLQSKGYAGSSGA